MATQRPNDCEPHSGSTTSADISSQALPPNLSDPTTPHPTAIAVEPYSHAWKSFATGSIAIGIAVYASAHYLPEFRPWAVASCVFVLSIAIMLPGIYIGSLRRLHENTLFRQDGLVYKLRTKRLLMTATSFVWSIGIAFYTLIQLNMFTDYEWAAFFLSFPIFYFTYRYSYKFLSRHVHPLHLGRISLTWARAVAPIAMLIVFSLIAWELQPSAPAQSLQQAINAKRASLLESHGSALVDESLQLFATITAAKEYMDSKLGLLSATLGKTLSILGTLVVGFTSASLLSCLVIPTAEYRRLFGPMTDAPTPPTVKPIKVAMWSAIIVFVFGFIYLHGFVAIESLIRQNPQWRAERETIERAVLTEVDEIAGEYFTPGTIRQIQEARARSIHAGDVALSALESQIDTAFDVMVRNVDLYLDWYYSLPAEYARIGLVLTGGVEEHLANNLTEHLNHGEPFKALSNQISDVISGSQEATAHYQNQKAKILSSNRISPPQDSVRIIGRLSRTELDILPTHPAVTGIEGRMAGAGAASVVSGLITAKVVGKVAGKTAFKLAAKGASKVFISKTGGAAAGTAAGAALGSIVPGIGTAAGAVVGFGVGLLFGVATDYALINLEEFVSRESFKAEIVASIAAAKAEFKAQLFNIDTPSPSSRQSDE